MSIFIKVIVAAFLIAASQVNAGTSLQSLLNNTKVLSVGSVKKLGEKKVSRFILKDKEDLYHKVEVTCSGQCVEDKDCSKKGFKLFTCVESDSCKKKEVVLNSGQPEKTKDRDWLFRRSN